ncbi:hypothetical protein KUCAC02_000901, partial [Chaenocephalus aceratus]
EPPRGDKGTCDFNSVPLYATEGTRPAHLNPCCVESVVECGSLLHISSQSITHDSIRWMK